MCSKNYRPKDVKSWMAKIREELKSIETTGIRHEGGTGKGPQIGCNFFFCKQSVYNLLFK
jgi:hypothetical protein